MPTKFPMLTMIPKSENYFTYLRTRVFALGVLSLAFGLVACQSVPTERGPGAVNGASQEEATSEVPSSPANSNGPAVTLTPEAYAVADLLSMLQQVLDPVHTTIQVGQSTQGSDGETVLRELAARGYGIQLVDADQGAHYLSFQKINEGSIENAQNFEFLIRVGSIEMMRTYTRIGSQDVRPISPMQIAGTRTRVNLDDRRFGTIVANDPLVSRVEYIGSQLAIDDVPVISLLKDPLAEQESDVPIGPSLIALNSSKVEINNRFYGTSAFNSITDNYDRIDRRTIIFPNDSMRLGSAGKKVISTFLNEYFEKTDLIGLIGCSNGVTKLDIGNEGLALGRASRITKELVSLGVGRDKILDEGCWAPTVAEEFPARGVVIELWRRST
ncbi:MAG: hypothetical protein KTR35_20520 [Gammaproteobacteria bacterium]|nr:hypothetical protein [Gammaproteobacteria bacterium]